MARDLRSHPAFREVFWESAHALGFGDAFSYERGFHSPETGHLAFRRRSFRRSVAIVDARSLVDAPGHAQSLLFTGASAESLEIVGGVTVEALGRIERRLGKIDRLSTFPLEADGE